MPAHSKLCYSLLGVLYSYQHCKKANTHSVAL